MSEDGSTIGNNTPPLPHLPDYHEKPLICVRGLTRPTCQSASYDRQIIQFFMLLNNPQVCLLVSVSLLFFYNVIYNVFQWMGLSLKYYA